MKIADLFPVDPGNISGEIADILASWLCTEVHQHKYFDTRACMTAIRVMVAFRALETEGTVDAFRRELYR